ncbi:MAG: YheU family protein [Cellvibrionaceae bacterium]|nr:YheU family protein [Cellvibrionaceae bacterium]
MIIPPQSLSAEALQGVMEEFISRDGTDYGEQELSLQAKVERLKPQVLRGDVLIVFDEAQECVTLMTQEEWRARQ